MDSMPHSSTVIIDMVRLSRLSRPSCPTLIYFLSPRRPEANRLCHRPDQGGEMQLPLALKSGETQSIVFSVGDDLESARAEGVFKSVQLRVHLSGHGPAQKDLELSFNGQHLGRPSGDKSAYQDPGAKQGTNSCWRGVTAADPIKLWSKLKASNCWSTTQTNPTRAPLAALQLK